jgi:centromere protein I
MFVDKLHKIDPPSQVIAGLRDPLLQRYLALNPSQETARRLDFWLQRYFEDELELIDEGFGTSPTLADMLTALVGFTEASKVRSRRAIWLT